MVLLLEFRNMDARIARRWIYERPATKIGFDQVPSNQICRFWQQGKCNRNPCRFIHSKPKAAISQLQSTQIQQRKRPSPSSSDEDQRDSKKYSWRRNETAALATEGVVNPREKIVTTTKKEPLDSTAAVTKKEQPESVPSVPQKAETVTITKKEQPDSVATITKKEQPDSVATIMKKEQPGSVRSIPPKAEAVSITKKEQPDSVATTTKEEHPDSVASVPLKAQKKRCQYWANGTCVLGDNCSDLHSWFTGSGISFVAKLEGHNNKAVNGVALPTGSDKLFSGSSDGTVCVWDCKNGQCVKTCQLGCEIGCVISEAPWVFVGLENGVKAWNLDNQTELHFSGANGLVHSLCVDDRTCTLFGGLQDGLILVWEATPESSHPVVVATYRGHQLAVTSLFVGDGVIVSGSEDKTIRVWDRKSSECQHVLNGHTGPVTSVICWGTFLISGSLDNSIKIWACVDGDLKVLGNLEDESGVLALKGICDKESNPILICSRTDNTVRLINLPDCTERGRIFTKGAVKTIATETISAESSRLFFTGDATGQIDVWRLDGQPGEGNGKS